MSPLQTNRLADRMSRLGTESAFEVLARARGLDAEGRKIIHLEIGEPDFDTPAHIVEAATEALRPGFTHYVPAPGLPEARESVAAWLSRTGRLERTPDKVIVTPGAKPIMWFLILATCQEGGEVVYPDPGFPMYESIARFTGPTPVPIQLREQNGAMTSQDCEAIAEIAMRHDLLVLADRPELEA